MDISLLKIFLSVAEESSLTEASRKLNTVQSNISARLKLLEDELGQPLFLRSRNGMILTEMGERLRPMAAEIVQKASDIKSELLKDAPVGNVTLGVPESFLRTYLRKPLEKWIKDHPTSRVHLKTGFSHQVTADLENRVIDFGVIISRQVPKQFHLLREFKSEVVVVAPSGVKEISKKTLVDLQPMLLGDSCFFGQALTNLCGTLGLEHAGLSYLHSIEAVIHCVSAGIGFSVMPRCLMENHSLKNQVSIHKYQGKREFSYFKVCLASRKSTALVREISKYL